MIDENQEGVDHAFEACDELLEVLDRLPEAAEEFADGVRDKALDIRATVERSGRATPGQLRALENMLRGAERWLR